jgi:hypothetical protein
VTDRETAIPEPLDEFVTKRETADHPVSPDAPAPEVGHLVEPDEGATRDDESDAVAAVAGGGDERPELGDIASGDTTLRDTAQERTPDLSAEEAAVHETESPPMGDRVPPAGAGDGYVDQDAVIDLRESTKQELYERAKELEIDGRSRMTKAELVDAIARRR